MSTSNPEKPAATKAPRARGRPAGRTSADGVIADRETLLAAAERLIRSKGPSVSLEAIAAAAGVTKPILYRGVGGRDALADALAQRLNERISEHVGKLIEGVQDPHDALRRLVGGYLAFAARQRNLYLYVTVGGGAQDQVHSSLLLADRSAKRLAATISAYRSDHGADNKAALTWAYGVIGALHFVTLWWLRDRPMDIEHATDQVTALFWSGLALEPAQPGARKPR